MKLSEVVIKVLLFSSRILVCQRQSHTFPRKEYLVVCRCCRWWTTTRSVYRLHDSSKAAPSCLARPSCVAGKVNIADELCLVIELVRPDTKHAQGLYCSRSC